MTSGSAAFCSLVHIYAGGSLLGKEIRTWPSLTVSVGCRAIYITCTSARIRQSVGLRQSDVFASDRDHGEEWKPSCSGGAHRCSWQACDSLFISAVCILQPREPLYQLTIVPQLYKCGVHPALPPLFMLFLSYWWHLLPCFLSLSILQDVSWRLPVCYHLRVNRKRGAVTPQG